MNIGLLVFVLAVAVTLLTSLFKTVKLSAKWKSLIAVVLSVVAGAVTVWAANGGDFSSVNVIEAVALVYAASQVIYNFILKGTSLDARLEAVGSGNTPTGA